MCRSSISSGFRSRALATAQGDSSLCPEYRSLSPARSIGTDVSAAGWFGASRRVPMRRTAVYAGVVASLGIGVLVSLSETTLAQNRTASGTIAGNVTADRGEVRALRVKAT